MNNIEFSSMQRNDIIECTNLFIRTFSKEPWNDTFDSSEEVITFMSNHMDNNYFIGYVARIDSRIVGLSIGFKKPWIKGLEYYIDQLCVDYNFQKQGFGSKLIKYIESDIHKKGMNAIILNTETGYPSEKFYKKNGFVELNGYIILAK